MKRKLLVLVVLIGNLSWAQSVSKVGTSSAKFLSVPVDAWGTGRGQAVVTGFDDASTLFWNPATISKLENMSAHFSYTKWFEGINFNYMAVVLPARNIGTFGLNATFYQTDPIEVTTEMYQEGTGEYYTVASYAIGMAYARRLTDKFSIGFNSKYIIENIYHSSASGIGFDIGGCYTTPWEGIHIGFAITNFGTKMQMRGEDLLVTVDPDPMNSGNNDVINAYYDTDEFEIPLSMTIGLAWEIIQTEKSRITVEIDGLYPSDNYSSVNSGLDASFFDDLIYLRTGITNLFLDSMTPRYAFGGGLKYPVLGGITICVNYAYQTHEYFTKNEHISISILF